MSRILFVDRRGKGRSPDFSPLGGPHRQERQCDTRSRRHENYKPHRRLHHGAPCRGLSCGNDNKLSLGGSCTFEFDDSRDRLGQRHDAADRRDKLALLGRFGNARQGLWRRIAEHQVMSRREQAANQFGESWDDVQRHAAAFQHRAALAQRQRARRIEDHVEATSIPRDVEGAIVDDLAHAQRQRFLAPGRAATPGQAGDGTAVMLQVISIRSGATTPASTS
jgi:hypothetical protein